MLEAHLVRKNQEDIHKKSDVLHLLLLLLKQQQRTSEALEDICCSIQQSFVPITDICCVFAKTEWKVYDQFQLADWTTSSGCVVFLVLCQLHGAVTTLKAVYDFRLMKIIFHLHSCYLNGSGYPSLLLYAQHIATHIESLNLWGKRPLITFWAALRYLVSWHSCEMNGIKW